MVIRKDEYSVKIAVIDEQHKRLFEIGNSISELVKDYKGQDTYDDIVKLVIELEKYTEYHFEEEEKILRQYRYPDIEEHIAEHRYFIKYLSGLDFNEIDNNQEEWLNKLVKFIMAWILKHILNTDFKYSDHLVKFIH